jgi:hydrogenase maturation protease
VSARVLVAGIGNLFLGDDGFGVEVARRLRGEPPIAGVTVSDVGIRTLHLAYALLDRPDLLLIIDAASRGEAPGTVYLIDPLAEGATAGAVPTGPSDAHGMNLDTVLSAVRNLGGELPPIRLVGCEPAFLGERMGLSAEVESAIPRAIEIVHQQIAQTLGSTAALAAEETGS